MQCGYCTPGMILGVAALLAANPDPDEARIRESLAGNICRCCTYPRIVRAARRAAELAASHDEGWFGGARRRTARAAGARSRTVGPARSGGARLLRRAPRRDGRGPRGRGGRGWRVVDEQRRMDPRRCGRDRHRVHGQGRRRPGQPDGPFPAGRRGVARAVRARAAGDGRHRSLPIRHGHVRQPVDAGRRREPARDRGVRSGALDLRGRGALGCRRGWTRRVRRRRPRTRRRCIDRLRRAPAWFAAGGASPGGERVAGDGMADGRDPDTEGDRGRDRDRRPAVPHGPLASGDAARSRPSSLGVRRDDAVGRCHRRASDARGERRARGRLRGCGRPRSPDRRARARRDPSGMGSGAPAVGRRADRAPARDPGRALRIAGVGRPVPPRDGRRGRGARGSRRSPRPDLHDRLHRARAARDASRSRSGKAIASPCGPARSGPSACGKSSPRRSTCRRSRCA